MERRLAARGARSWVAAVATALILLVLLAVPMSAATTRTKLSNAAVTPRSGTTATTIAVSVTYQNANGSRADTVSVAFGSRIYLMARDAGGSWGKGVTFRWSGKLPAGRHAVVFSAKAKNEGDASLAAGSVTIANPPAPAPASTPTPRPTPKPKPTPTPTPDATPRATNAPTAPTPTPTATAGSGTTDPLTTPEPTPVPVPSTDPEPDDIPMAGPTSGPPDGLVTAVVVGAGGGSHGSGPGSGPGRPGVSDSSIDPNGGPSEPRPHGGWGPLAGVLAFAGLQNGPAFPAFGLAPTLVTTTSAVGAAMALSLFGRRRRDDDPPDALMAASAANGVAVAAYDVIGQAQVDSEEEVDMELLLPRWRRPSLLQARKADPIRDQVQAPRLTFDEGLVGPLAGRERRIIRYRVVRLLDTPDELRGVEIGYLDQGDEVQLLEKYGAYWLVVAPDGQQGWLHKMTLGDIHETDSGSGERPTASMPIAADSWTMAESDIDSDVLEAYLESRRRSA